MQMDAVHQCKWLGFGEEMGLELGRRWISDAVHGCKWWLGFGEEMGLKLGRRWISDAVHGCRFDDCSKEKKEEGNGGSLECERKLA